MRAVLANLGFILEMSGAFMAIPIALGFIHNETNALVSLFITAFAFFFLGFVLNSLAEKCPLNVMSCSLLLALSIIIMGLIGAIPYLYLNTTGGDDALSKVTNAYFESVSGYTTTGFSFIADEGLLPKSIILYRAMSELMGGLGLVFMFVALMYPEKSIGGFNETLGVEKVGRSMRRTYFVIMGIYAIYILAITGIFRVMGFEDIITTAAFVIHAITGGFQPPNADISRYFGYPTNILVTITMLIGALTFVFHHRIFTRKFRAAFTDEVLLYFTITFAGGLLLLFRTDLVSAFFHSASFSSNAGFYYFAVQSSGDTTKLLLITLMFIGGCSFSLAAGIRVSRVLLFFRSIGSVLKRYVEEYPAEHHDESHEKTTETLVTFLLILLSVFIIFLASVAFSATGLSYIDALFEATSAYSTTGATLGSISLGMGLGMKWMVIALMLVGRLEVTALLLAVAHFSSRVRGPRGTFPRVWLRRKRAEPPKQP